MPKIDSPKVCVVIPCYKVKNKVIDVINKIPDFVSQIICVDDKCPEKSGQYIKNTVNSKKLKVIYHEKNKGVGGAVITGYLHASKINCDIAVKIDGDGQMDPGHIKKLINPILEGQADYTKGNRFFSRGTFSQMPFIRKVGNIGLSFLTKLSTGYWNIFDPTNGFTAIHCKLIPWLQLEKVDERYFFETDMLFRLNTIRAAVKDIPINAIYNDEESNLSNWNTLLQFPPKHLKRFIKRIGYNYYVRDFSIASIALLCGIPLISWGLIFGIYQWQHNATKGVATPSGTVMLSALPIIIGFQLLISFLNYDISNTPKDPQNPFL